MVKIISKLIMILFLLPHIGCCEEKRPDVVINSFISETSKYLKELDSKSLINLIPENFQLIDTGSFEELGFRKKIFNKKDIVLYFSAVRQFAIPIQHYFCVTNIVNEGNKFKIYGYAQAQQENRRYFNLLSRKYSLSVSIVDGIVKPECIFSSGFLASYTDEEPKSLYTQFKNVFFRFLILVNTNDKKK